MVCLGVDRYHRSYNRPIEGEVGKYDREVEMDVDGYS